MELRCDYIARRPPARRPRFAAVFWTLTWAEAGPGRPTEHFQLTISGRPLRFDLQHSVLPQSIMPETAPLPVSCFLHQSAFHWIVRIRETGADHVA
jgi:hypothetical protein